VPAGEHTLIAYHPDLGSIREQIVVEAGERVRVERALGD
jgi:hypothetical protein